MQDKIKKDINGGDNIKNIGAFHIEADRIREGISVSVCGVYSVLEFTEEFCVLKIRQGRIKIAGKKLSIAVYENKTVEIFGKVGAIEFIC